MTPQTGLLLGGRYELRTRIAVGGMGEVWQAADKHLDRKVAAKVLRAEFAGDQSFLARMRAEARNGAGLSHINVTAMYDYGEQDGSGYLIMELVEGEPLSELLSREHTLPPGQLLPIMAQTARGLHAAHVAGVVHRDVKPSNLLIMRDGTVKITDFGIALGANQAPMTAAGMVMGTAQYLPPEQAMGKPATGVGDIYALGIIAYEALVGRRPFTGSTQVDIAFAHVNQAVPPLPDTVDRRVRNLVMSMLDKDPERRPRSGASLARTLDALLRDLHNEAMRNGAPMLASHGEQVTKLPTQAMPLGSEAQKPAARDMSGQSARRDASSVRSEPPRSSEPPRLRRAVVAPVLGSSALQLEEDEDEAVAESPVPNPVSYAAPAADGVPHDRGAPAVAQPVTRPDPATRREALRREAPSPASQTRPRAAVERAAGVRRPVLPNRRERDPLAEPPPRSLPTPQWAPLGGGRRRAHAAHVPASRPRKHRHDRPALRWTWRSGVKVLLAVVMLIALMLWLGTLAEANALTAAVGAVGVLAPDRPTADGSRSGRRRPESG